MNLGPLLTRARLSQRSRSLLVCAASLAVTLGSALSACNQPPPNTEQTCPTPPTCQGTFRDGDAGSTTVGFTPTQNPVVNTTGCSLARCGNLNWQVNFSLPNPAANSGWIVQEITDNLSETPADGGPACYPSRSVHFFEAFYVQQGTMDTNNIYPGGDDSYVTAHDSPSAGMETVMGTARFYEGVLPPDFIYCNDAGLSGARRSTTTTPPGWDGTGTPHNLTMAWDCADGGNGTSSVQLTPSFPCSGGSGTGVGGGGAGGGGAGGGGAGGG